MQVSVKVDVTSAIGMLTDFRQSQLPYATSRALNDVADKAVLDLVSWVQRIFNFRGQTGWIKRKWFQSKWSNRKDNPIVAYVIATIDYLLLHEVGGIKTPHRGASLAVPLGSWRNKRIPASMRPRYLLGGDLQGLLRSASLRGKASRRKQIANFGKAFIIELGGKRFVAMRTTQDIGMPAYATRLRGIRLLYVLTPAVRIVPRLRMRETVTGTVRRESNAAFARRMAEAIRTAKR